MDGRLCAGSDSVLPADRTEAAGHHTKAGRNAYGGDAVPKMQAEAKKRVGEASEPGDGAGRPGADTDSGRIGKRDANAAGRKKEQKRTERRKKMNYKKIIKKAFFSKNRMR